MSSLVFSCSNKQETCISFRGQSYDDNSELHRKRDYMFVTMMLQACFLRYICVTASCDIVL